MAYLPGNSSQTGLHGNPFSRFEVVMEKRARQGMDTYGAW